jgi:hypothetical protein
LNNSFIYDSSLKKQEFNSNDYVEITKIKSNLKKSMKTKKNEGRFVVFKMDG